jgi:hypothetical protein
MYEYVENTHKIWNILVTEVLPYFGYILYMEPHLIMPHV